MASGCIWQQNALLFRRLYIEDNKTLKDVKSAAEGSYGFPRTSLSTYETKLRDILGLRKNLTPEGWVAIGQHLKAEKKPNWEVYTNGRRVSKKKVMKEIGRYTKRRSYPKNLPMPPGAEIRWTGLSRSQFSGVKSSGLLPQQQDARTSSSSEHTEISGDHSSMLPISTNDALFSCYNKPDIINETVNIATAARSAISFDFSAAVLDPHLSDLWNPVLNHLPFGSLRRTLDQFFYDIVAPSFDNGLLQIPRVATLGICPSETPSFGANLHQIVNRRLEASHGDYAHGQPGNGTMSASFDPFRILGLLVYYLSNQFEGLSQTRETMIFVMEQVPQSLVREFLRSGSPAVEAAWMPLAEWSLELNKLKFFKTVMKVSLSFSEWVELHGARCLILAAYFGCVEIVHSIIACGVSPNDFSEFEVPDIDNNTVPSFLRLAAVELNRAQFPKGGNIVRTFPLLEAAARSNLEVLEILKDAKANSRLRAGGMTAAGHVLFAQDRGAVDMHGSALAISFLLEMEEDLNAPLWQSDFQRTPGRGVASDETLLDAIYLRHGSSQFFRELKKRSQTPDGVLTVAGLLQSAEDGQHALRNYSANIRYPSGLLRTRIEEIALIRSLQRPECFDSMMKCGHSLDIKTFSVESDTPFYKNHDLPRYNEPAIVYFLRKIDSFPATVAQYIVNWATEGRDYSCLPHMEIENLVIRLEPMHMERLGLELLRRSIAANRTSAVASCLQGGVNPQSIDLLKVAQSDTDILDLLYEYGVRPVLSSQFLDERNSGPRPNARGLRWLMTHGLVLDGMSMHDIIIRFLQKEVERQELCQLGQWLKDCGYPLYTRRHSTSHFRPDQTSRDQPSLALLIYFGSSIDSIIQLLDQGVDVNKTFEVIEKRRTLNFRDYSHEMLANKTNWEYETAIEAAIRQHNISMVQALIFRGANVNERTIYRQTILEISVLSYVQASDTREKAARKQIILTLLEHGADPNDGYRDLIEYIASPALVLAVVNRKPDVQLVQWLLRKGARAETRSEKFGSSLFRDMLMSRSIDWPIKKEIFSLFLANGAQYRSSDELVCACLEGDVKVAQLHLEKNADPNALVLGKRLGRAMGDRTPSPIEKRHPETISPLEASAREGNIPIALILLAAGATISSEDLSLSIAAEFGRLDMVALLLPHVKDLDKVKEALNYATTERHYSIIRLLKHRLATAEGES